MLLCMVIHVHPQPVGVGNVDTVGPSGRVGPTVAVVALYTHLG